MATPAEWSKEAIKALIDEYKRHPLLYNPKMSPLYYNKQARQKAIDDILKAVEPFRSNTTSHDVIKKIQVLRTQYGQELSKIRKSDEIGSKYYVYKPKIWWFKELEFLKNYMKTRSSGRQNVIEEIEIEEEDSEQETPAPTPAKKRLRLSEGGKITIEEKEVIWENDPKSNNDTSKSSYVIYEDNSIVENDGQQSTEQQIIVAPYKEPKETKRHEEFGKFVAAQMATIQDDLLYYSTQHDILTIINKAQIKQLEKNLE